MSFFVLFCRNGGTLTILSALDLNGKKHCLEIHQIILKEKTFKKT